MALRDGSLIRLMEPKCNSFAPRMTSASTSSGAHSMSALGWR
jgi:hypothetical protein